MRASLFLAAFDPMHEVPRVCGLCSGKPPVFNYEFRTYSTSGDLSENQGFCCASCASNLVKQLERNEAQVWPHKRPAQKPEDVDLSALPDQRVASFPTRN